MKARAYVIEGTAPLMMQSDKLADPIGDDAKELKKFSGKRKKTDDDHEAMKRIEWGANLYTDNKGVIIVPSQNIFRMIVEAARLSKKGKDVERGCMIMINENPLYYDGPKSLRALYENARFVDRRTVVVSRSRVMRTRPIFPTWSLPFTVNYDPDVIDMNELDGFVETAGKYIGLGNYRPRFGRFEVKSSK